MPTVSLLAVGNELLNGEIKDENLFFLSRTLTRLGMHVSWVAVVRDQYEEIGSIVRFMLAGQPDLLICSGGLGPTADDLTLAALGRALDLPLTLNSEARVLVDAHYEQLIAAGYLKERGPESVRRKMALLPAGADPLPNPVGTAPGVRLLRSQTRIYALPGVPEELQAMFKESIVPDLRHHFDVRSWAEEAIYVRCNDEGQVAEVLHAVSERHPGVYVKSLAHPFPSAGTEGLKVIAAGSAPDEAQAHEAVRDALDDLRKSLETAGFASARSRDELPTNADVT